MKKKIILLSILTRALIPMRAFSVNTPPDSTLYTNYTLSSDLTSISFIVCGSSEDSEGCYGGGGLAPFAKLGAMLESASKTDVSTNTVSGNIYVLDLEAGTIKASVTLYVYTKSDVITSSFTPSALA